ncbi:hypothetical protein DPMN_023541 [Dreissena polymorpha]|uniref:Uncharacterized protein n=1 Tax=Dreissena polymorpha TaxID=45954 RepID=A0A9D4LMF7_DREPO|nr:hypothetical protein DPMN_023541 [Dreissena polymorpha]
MLCAFNPKEKQMCKSRMVKLIWCPPNDRDVPGSVPIVGAFLRSPPKTRRTERTKATDSTSSQ